MLCISNVYFNLSSEISIKFIVSAIGELVMNWSIGYNDKIKQILLAISKICSQVHNHREASAEVMNCQSSYAFCIIDKCIRLFDFTKYLHFFRHAPFLGMFCISDITKQPFEVIK